MLVNKTEKNNLSLKNISQGFIREKGAELLDFIDTPAFVRREFNFTQSESKPFPKNKELPGPVIDFIRTMFKNQKVNVRMVW